MFDLNNLIPVFRKQPGSNSENERRVIDLIRKTNNFILFAQENWSVLTTCVLNFIYFFFHLIIILLIFFFFLLIFKIMFCEKQCGDEEKEVEEGEEEDEVGETGQEKKKRSKR